MSSVVYVSPEDKIVSEVNPFLIPVKNVKPIQRASSKFSYKLYRFIFNIAIFNLR